MNSFTIRELRERTGDLIRDARAGGLSVVTRHGRPVFIALPFDENVVKFGVPLALAVKLFQEEVLSLGKSARFADCSVAEFTERLGEAGIASVRYSVEDLDEELATMG